MNESATGKKRRLIIVSNRLPVTAGVVDGQMTLGPSSGGLVSALGAFLARRKTEEAELSEFLWVGWPGNGIEAAHQSQVRRCLLVEHNCEPVFLADDVMDRFYLGFCNKTLWPLFHYFPTLTVYEESMWEVYEQVNRRFCEVVAGLLQPGDVIIIPESTF